LGFLVSHHGIEANLDKVKAIEEMRPLRNLKEMQRLAGCIEALGRFIAGSGEKALYTSTKVQKPIYFVSTMLRDAREHYTMQQKLLYTDRFKETTSILPGPPDPGGH
jgi:hypothetical protein